MNKKLVAGSEKWQYIPLIFDIDAIYTNLLDVQRDFPAINRSLSCQRDQLNNEVIHNLLTGYEYINFLLVKRELHQLTQNTMLRLNQLVHTGNDPSKELEYMGFMNSTRDKVDNQSENLMKWYKRHTENKDDPYELAAGLYVRVLAMPQLFIEGNHRTGSLIANLELLLFGQNPFILTPDNAVQFFNLASDVKFFKADVGSHFKRLVGWRDEKHRMREFLKSKALPFVKRAQADELQKPERVFQYTLQDSP